MNLSKIPQPPKFKNPREKRVYLDLRDLIGQGPATLFQDAYRLMYNPEIRVLESRSHLIGHCWREIESAIRDVIEPMGVKITEEKKVDKGVHRKNIRAILGGLEIDEANPIAQNWLSLAGEKGALHRLAHRDNLNYRTVEEAEWENLWPTLIRIFEFILDQFRSRFGEVLSQLDTLLAVSKPSAEDMATFVGSIPNSYVAHEHFFSNLDNVEWLNPLFKKGFFKKPPQIKPADGGEGWRLPLWPQVIFLKRMAGRDPATVLRIIKLIPPTDNSNTHEHYLDAALQMSASQAVQLIENKIGEILDAPFVASRLLADKLAEIIVLLSKNWEGDAAFNLASTLFRLEKNATTTSLNRGKVKSTIADDWHYAKSLKKCVPVLRDADPLRTIDLLSKALRHALDQDDIKNERDPSDDISFLWYGNLDKFERRNDEPVNNLISILQETITDICSKNSRSTHAIIKILDSQDWLIFQRLILDILRKYPTSVRKQISKRLLDQELFEHRTVRDEYQRLLREQFGSLKPQEQKVILDMIDSGPASLRELEDRKWLKMWQRDRLSLIAKYLPDQWRKRYQRLIKKYGKASRQEPNGLGTTWEGPTSPKTPEELKDMSVEEICKSLREWKPPETFAFSDSAEGFSRNIKIVVAEDPTRFVSKIDLFRDVDPTYARGLIDGLQKSQKENRPFDWNPVLDFCHWLVQQPRDFTSPRPEDADPHMGWIRKAIIDLISGGLRTEESAGGIPFNYRKTVWRIIEPITQDPSPTPQEESEHEKSLSGPYSLAINSVRSEAVDAAVRYGLWCARNLFNEKDRKDPESAERNFKAYPEIKVVLEVHLDKKNDPSRAVRSVYAARLPNIHYLDREWLQQNINKIFSLKDSSFDSLGKAAWETYLVIGEKIHLDIVKFLMPYYFIGVDRLTNPEARRLHNSENVDERLAEHLMVFALTTPSGLTRLEELLNRFWKKATKETAAGAISFIGRSFTSEAQASSQDMLHRATILWEDRFKIISSGWSADPRLLELSAFGSWFSSGQFDKEWSLIQLSAALKLYGETEESYHVVEKLAELAPKFPEQSITCLRLLAEGDQKGWGVLSSEKEIRNILGIALKGSSPEAQKGAIELINRLASWGYKDYLSLLKVGAHVEKNLPIS